MAWVLSVTRWTLHGPLTTQIASGLIWEYTLKHVWLNQTPVVKQVAPSVFGSMWLIVPLMVVELSHLVSPQQQDRWSTAQVVTSCTKQMYFPIFHTIFFKNNIWSTSALFSFRINNSTFKCFDTNCQSSSSLSFEKYFIIIVFSQVSCLSILWIFWGISHQTNWMDPGCTELHWTEQWTGNQDLRGWTGSSNR